MTHGDQHGHEQHGHEQHGQHGGHEQHSGHEQLTEMLDLDAEVLSDFYREVITWVGGLAPAHPRIVDIGAGSGTGTLALARALPEAELIAVDLEERMLAHLRTKAAEAGVAGRIRTVQADLDKPWPRELAPADVLWASASMHHLADPAAALAQASAALKPGGLFVISELDSFPRFLPDPQGAALEARAQREQARIRQERGLHMGLDWGARLAEAGFTLEADRRFDIVLAAPLPPATGRYAAVCLGRLHQSLADRLSPADLAALEGIAATVATRDDLRVTTERTVWIGRAA